MGMEEFRLGDQIARYDRDATITAYQALRSGDADRCGCVYCRNFSIQRATVYPSEFRNLLEKFGVDVNKEGEIFDGAGPFEPPSRPIGGWFYFVGELIEEGEKLVSDGDFQYWFQPFFPRPPACFGEPVLAIEFATKIPWALKEDP
jgi:hypothetical protein